MSSASAVTSHAAALAAVAASSRADARARVASSVGAAPRSGARAPRARAAVRTRAASFSSGDAAPELVEGPRGEVYASADEALAYASRDDDDAFEDVGASQSGSGGYGARRTTRKKKGRKSSGYAQGTRGAGGAFGSRSENTAFFSQASGSFSSGYDVRTAREDRRRRGDDHLFECVGAEWRERERLAGPTRALQRARRAGEALALAPLGAHALEEVVVAAPAAVLARGPHVVPGGEAPGRLGEEGGVFGSRAERAARAARALSVAAGFTPLLLARGPARAVPARARLRRADVLERVVVVAAGVRERLVRARVHLPARALDELGGGVAGGEGGGPRAHGRARAGRARAGPRRGAHGRRDARARVSARRRGDGREGRSVARHRARARHLLSLAPTGDPSDGLTCATRASDAV